MLMKFKWFYSTLKVQSVKVWHLFQLGVYLEPGISQYLFLSDSDQLWAQHPKRGQLLFKQT